MPPESSPPEVVFARSGLTLCWDPDCESLLELAEKHGLTPDHMCREGGCNTCLSRLLEGEVAYTRKLLLPPPHGYLLLCCTRPAGRVVVDV